MIENIIIVIGVTIFGVQHSGISSLRVKNAIIDRWSKETYATIFNVSSVLAVSIAFLSMNYWDWLYFIFAPHLIVIPLLILGFVFLISGLYIAFEASSVISVSTVADMRTDRQPELITDGIYSRIRHPLYLATIVMFLAIGFIYPNPRVLVFVAGMVLYTLVGAYFEERKLILHYGETYLEYAKNVGFIIPKIGS